MKIIVGLGNFGDKYNNTRHNIGFDFIDELSKKFNITVKEKKFKALIGSGYINFQKVTLVKPLTYMNLSGDSVIEVQNFFKVPLEDIIIVFDDISLNLGQIRIRKKGSAGGHNGIKSIILRLGSNEFPRIKIGVGQKPQHIDLADYVLGHFSKDELEDKNKGINNAIKALELILENDYDKAMNAYNTKC